ncbi:MAG: hypothetical protein J6T84_00735 [Spirochaetaceae bacterium]|nr:hypothetical protein [Spirochaetaceae bacterium]
MIVICSNFLSEFLMPDETAVVITGSDISTETKTGTFDDVNQNNANRINETTGVTFIIFIGNEKKISIAGKIPQSKPKNNDKITETTNAEIQRNIVTAICDQNNDDFISSNILEKTLCGNGAIIGEFT